VTAPTDQCARERGRGTAGRRDAVPGPASEPMVPGAEPGTLPARRQHPEPRAAPTRRRPRSGLPVRRRRHPRFTRGAVTRCLRCAVIFAPRSWPREPVGARVDGLRLRGHLVAEGVQPRSGDRVRGFLGASVQDGFGPLQLLRGAVHRCGGPLPTGHLVVRSHPVDLPDRMFDYTAACARGSFRQLRPPARRGPRHRCAGAQGLRVLKAVYRQVRRIVVSAPATVGAWGARTA